MMISVVQNVSHVDILVILSCIRGRTVVLFTLLEKKLFDHSIGHKGSLVFLAPFL